MSYWRYGEDVKLKWQGSFQRLDRALKEQFANIPCDLEQFCWRFQVSAQSNSKLPVSRLRIFQLDARTIKDEPAQLLKDQITQLQTTAADIVAIEHFTPESLYACMEAIGGLQIVDEQTQLPWRGAKLEQIKQLCQWLNRTDLSATLQVAQAYAHCIQIKPLLKGNELFCRALAGAMLKRQLNLNTIVPVGLLFTGKGAKSHDQALAQFDLQPELWLGYFQKAIKWSTLRVKQLAVNLCDFEQTHRGLNLSMYNIRWSKLHQVLTKMPIFSFSSFAAEFPLNYREVLGLLLLMTEGGMIRSCSTEPGELRTLWYVPQVMNSVESFDQECCLRVSCEQPLAGNKYKLECDMDEVFEGVEHHHLAEYHDDLYHRMPVPITRSAVTCWY